MVQNQNLQGSSVTAESMSMLTWRLNRVQEEKHREGINRQLLRQLASVPQTH